MRKEYKWLAAISEDRLYKNRIRHQGDCPTFCSTSSTATFGSMMVLCMMRNGQRMLCGNAHGTRFQIPRELARNAEVNTAKLSRACSHDQVLVSSGVPFAGCCKPSAMDNALQSPELKAETLSCLTLNYLRAKSAFTTSDRSLSAAQVETSGFTSLPPTSIRESGCPQAVNGTADRIARLLHS